MNEKKTGNKVFWTRMLLLAWHCSLSHMQSVQRHVPLPQPKDRFILIYLNMALVSVREMYVGVLCFVYFFKHTFLWHRYLGLRVLCFNTCISDVRKGKT